MTEFTIHAADTAPEASRDLLSGVQAKFGFLPTILGAMAEAPATLEAYITVSGIFEKSDLNAVERQLVLLAISRENACHFCVAAHSGGSKKAGLDDAAIEAAREGTPLADAKLNALRDFAIAMTLSRGHVTAQALQSFLDAGYTKQNALEVVLAVSVKVLTNYTDALADVPLNKELSALAWVPPSKRSA